MNKFVIVGCVIACGQLPAVGQEAGPYVEVGYALQGIDIVDQDFDTSAAQARGGYMITPYLGVEAEGSYGLKGASIEGQGTAISVRVDGAIAGYAIARWPVADRIELIGRVGYQQIDVSVKAEEAGEPTTRMSGDGEGVVYGGGVQFQLDGFAVRADYTWSSEASPFPASDRIETISVGIAKRF